jgi:type IV secretion system protein TrbI
MELHPKPKQPIQLNRPLIITIAIVVVAVLLLAIITALTSADRVKNDAAAFTPKISSDKLTVSSELTGLPGDYSDIDAIKKYSADSSSSQLVALLQKFSELQDEYALLKKQLLNQDRTPKKPPIDPKLQQARESSLIVSGAGSKAENMLGGTDKSGQPGADGKDTPVPTPAQEEFYKKQAQDNQKLATMKGKDNPDEIYDLHNIVKPASKYLIQAGTLIPATLITGIDSTLNGTLIAQVTSNMYDTVSGKHLLVPRGSKLLGEYEARISTGQRRALLYFTRIVRPDGSSILLGKPLGVDGAGQSGVEGDVDNHWARVIGASTISTILSAGAGIAGGNTNNYNPTYRQNAFSSMGQSVSGTGQNIVNRELNVPPTLKVPPGAQFNVAVRRDMILTPYNTKNY